MMLNIPWQQVVMTGGVACATYVAYFLFVRPFRHPLRKVPGLPYKPIVGNLREITTGEAMESTIKMVAKYGTIVRYYFFFGIERLIIACPETMKHILVTNCKNYVKPPGRIKILRAVLGEGLVLLEGNEHAAHKRLMSPSFNHSSIKAMIPVFEDCAMKLVYFWEDAMAENKGIVQAQKDLARTTLDVIGRTAFGHDFNSLQNPDEPVNRAFQDVLQGTGLNWRMAIPFYFHLPFADVTKLRISVATMHNKVMEIVKQRRAKEQSEDNESNDLLGIIMRARDQTTGQGLSDKELKDEVMTLMSAGHETTATAMSWFLLIMAQHPDIQSRCRQEVIKAGDDVTWDTLDGLEYLGKAIKETLRMYAPVPLTLRQALNDDVYQGKYHIPAGTISLLSLGPMMRSPDLFKDPDTFNPDRFDDMDSNASMYTFLPFLIGPRMCLGYKFALMEMKAILSVLLRHYTFDLVPGTSYKRKSRLTMRPEPQLTLDIKKYNFER